MLAKFELLLFVLFVLMLITQVLIPLVMGRTLFPTLRLHKESKALAQAHWDQEKAALHQEIRDLLREIETDKANATKPPKKECLNPDYCGTGDADTICESCGNQAA